MDTVRSMAVPALWLAKRTEQHKPLSPDYSPNSQVSSRYLAGSSHYCACFSGVWLMAKGLARSHTKPFAFRKDVS